MKRIIVLGLAGALWGCGLEPAASKETTVADIRTRTLARLDALESQTANGPATVKDVQQIVQSLRFLAGHARTQKVGSEEQIATIEDLAGQLAQMTAGPARQPEDWRPGDDKPGAAPVITDTAALRDLLTRLRPAVQALR